MYIEITNICGLQCSFCPPKINPTHTMSLDFFEEIVKQIKPYTKLVALHVLGDPLVVKNLEKYLDVIEKYNLKAMITTTGYYLQRNLFPILSHKAIKQINFSLNSYNKNAMKQTFEDYIDPIIEFCKYKVQKNIPSFINLRLWNLDAHNSEEKFNQKVFEILYENFGVKIDQSNVKQSIRLDNKVLLQFDQYFIWPSLENQIVGNGYCHGLSSQIAILSNGVVVPCCLDCDGHINLGNLHTQTLNQILNNQKSQNIIEGFKNNLAIELLCQKCSYKERFNQ